MLRLLTDLAVSSLFQDDRVRKANNKNEVQQALADILCERARDGTTGRPEAELAPTPPEQERRPHLNKIISKPVASFPSHMLHVQETEYARMPPLVASPVQQEHEEPTTAKVTLTPLKPCAEEMDHKHVVPTPLPTPAKAVSVAPAAAAPKPVAVKAAVPKPAAVVAAKPQPAAVPAAPAPTKELKTSVAASKGQIAQPGARQRLFQETYENFFDFPEIVAYLKMQLKLTLTRINFLIKNYTIPGSEFESNWWVIPLFEKNGNLEAKMPKRRCHMSNHPAGKGCLRSRDKEHCAFVHKCVWCNGDHGLCERDEDGEYLCPRQRALQAALERANIKITEVDGWINKVRKGDYSASLAPRPDAEEEEEQ